MHKVGGFGKSCDLTAERSDEGTAGSNDWIERIGFPELPATELWNTGTSRSAASASMSWKSRVMGTDGRLVAKQRQTPF